MPANARPRLSRGVASEDLIDQAGRDTGWPTMAGRPRLGEFQTCLSAQAVAGSQECARLAGRQQAPCKSPGSPGSSGHSADGRL